MTSDTPAHVEKLYRDLLMRRSGEERLVIGCRMFDAARALVRASLGDPNGTDDSPEMRVALFLRTYGQDFDPQTRDRLAARLRERALAAGAEEGPAPSSPVAAGRRVT